ncbi:MAG: hypothetical protein ACOCW3_05540 [Spirochaetota bacterium]
MKKRILLGLAVVMIVSALTGCEWLLAPRVGKISPEDLRSYSAGTTFKEDEEAVLEAMDVTGKGAGEGTGSVLIESIDEDLGFAVQGSTFEAVFNGLVQHSIDAARSIAPSRSVTEEDKSDFDDPDDIEIDYTLEILDESVNGADVFEPDGGGTATVESFYLEVTGSGTSDSTSDPTSGEFDAKGEQEGVFTYDEWTDGTNFVIHEGRVNSEGSGRVSVEAERSGESGEDVAGNLFWRFGYAVNAGFSVSNLTSDEGGKIIVSFRYWGRENIDFDSSEELESQAQGEFEAEMTIRVYDNNNDLVAEHEFTDEDVYEETTADSL